MSLTADAGERDDVLGSGTSDYRPLRERLALLAEHLPVSHVPADTPFGRLVGALVEFVEHGPDLLDAADDDAEHVERQLRAEPGQRSVPTGVAEILVSGYPDPADVQVNGGDRAELERLRAANADLRSQQGDQREQLADALERLQRLEEREAPHNADQAPPEQRAQLDQIQGAASATTTVESHPAADPPHQPGQPGNPGGDLEDPSTIYRAPTGEHETTTDPGGTR